MLDGCSSRCSSHSMGHMRHASSWAFWRKAPTNTEQPGGFSMDSGDSFPTASPPPSIGPSQLSEVTPTVDTLLPETPLSAESISQACDAVEQASIAAAQADAFFTTALFMDAFTRAHDLGLPWWGALAAVNVTTRLVMSPAIIMQQKATAKMLAFNMSMMHAKELQQQLARAKTLEEQQRLSHALREEYDLQVAKHGHPLKIVYVIPLVLIANATIFISIFSATSQLMATKAPSLMTGGMLWFQDLTVPDAYNGLPVLCCLVTLAMVEYGITLNGEQSPMMQQQAATFKWLMRMLSLLFIPTGAYVPAGVATLWVSNSAFGVVQGFLLRSSAFRASVGLPSLQHMQELSARLAEANRPGQQAPVTPPSFTMPPPPGTPPRSS